MVGVADRMRRPVRAAIDAVAATGTIGREEAARALDPGAHDRVSLFDQWPVQVWPGVRRAASGKAEPGADAGPAAPQAPP
jgi:hypothetical protein